MPDLLLSPMCCCGGEPCDVGFEQVFIGAAELWYPTATPGSSSVGLRNSAVMADVGSNDVDRPTTALGSGGGLGGPGRTGRFWLFPGNDVTRQLESADNIIDVTTAFSLSFWVDIASTGNGTIQGSTYLIGSLATTGGGSDIFFGVRSKPTSPLFTGVTLGVDSPTCGYNANKFSDTIPFADLRLFCCYRYRDDTKQVRLTIGDTVDLLHTADQFLDFHMEPLGTSKLKFGGATAVGGNMESDAYLDQINICNSFVSDAKVSAWWASGSGTSGVTCS